MPAYIVNQFEIFDPETYKEYQKLGAPTIKQHGGRGIAAGGKTEDLAGGPTFPGDIAPRIVILEFPSYEQARNWYFSPEYQAAIRVRDTCARARTFIVDGKPPEL